VRAARAVTVARADDLLLLARLLGAMAIVARSL
jgi:hypothetical protein